VRLTLALVAFVACLGGVCARGAETNADDHPPGAQPERQSNSDRAVPSFLPSYFGSALQVPGVPLHLADHQQKDNQSRYVYVSDDQVVNLTVESLKCDSALCETVYQNAARYIDGQVTDNIGEFREANGTEFRADWQTGLSSNFLFCFKLPSFVLFWSYSTRLDRAFDVAALFSNVKALVDRLRYEDALRAGNVEMGHWDVQIRRRAEALLNDGRKAEALGVLQQLLATSPSDYQAHLEFMENTKDEAAARDSARTILENSEDPILLAKAARFLGITEPSIEALPLLSKGERGLQLILIPLPPCNVVFLDEAAKIYEKITDVPAKIVRLSEPWNFTKDDRIVNQKSIRETIIQNIGPTANFDGWTKKDYENALIKTVSSKSALTKFSMESYVKKIDEEPNQYLVDPYLARFLSLISKYRSDDKRTMYVGVTEANIYSGDTNFVFSEYTTKDGLGGSVLSYSMMMTKTLGEAYESQRRLAERMAKELVPASLKSLNIPRPSDPSDPYSYSSGVDRLAQKGLTLSQSTKEALDKFRDAATQRP
jgi:predicted Zn-dependent protease